MALQYSSLTTAMTVNKVLICASYYTDDAFLQHIHSIICVNNTILIQVMCTHAIFC